MIATKILKKMRNTKNYLIIIKILVIKSEGLEETKMKLENRCDLDKDLENEDYKEYGDYEVCPVCEKRIIEFGNGQV